MLSSFGAIFILLKFILYFLYKIKKNNSFEGIKNYFQSGYQEGADTDR